MARDASGCWTEAAMDTLTSEFVRACSLDELKAKGRLVVHGRYPPILLVYDQGRVFALDNRCRIWASRWSEAASQMGS